MLNKTKNNPNSQYNKLNNDFGVIITLENKKYYATLVANNKNAMPTNLNLRFPLTTFENKTYMVVEKFVEENIFHIHSRCAESINLINEVKIESQSPSNGLIEDLEEHDFKINKLSNLLKINPIKWIESSKKLNKFLNLVGLELRVVTKNKQYSLNELFNFNPNKKIK